MVVAPNHFKGVFRSDELARAVYSECAGIARTLPRAIAVPRDAEDVVRLVEWAREHETSLIARGSGSSMAGGAIGDGVIVDLSRLDAIGSIEREPPRVTVGPGAIHARVNERAAARDLRFPVDPSSSRFCSIGGMVATNAAGAHSLSFGATRRWVTALDCVFADGTRALVRRGAEPPANVPAIERFLGVVEELRHNAGDGRCARRAVRKESSGYAIAEYLRTGELIDLLVGSEGTLAIFVGIELALTARPRATSSLLASFPTLESAVEAAGIARSEGASACELLDRTFLDIAREGESVVPVSGNAEAVLLVEMEGLDSIAAEDAIKLLRRRFLDLGAIEVTVALHPLMERMLWTLRHAASPILSRLGPSTASMQFIEDGAVPPERLADYVRGIRSALARRKIRGVIFGHAGDSHVHVNPLIDLRRPDWRKDVRELMEEVTELTISLGGTLAGEHGDGRLRAPFLARAWSHEAVKLFRAVKRAFDPGAILNPGVKLPLRGQQPIAAVKYDPALPPLPSAARRALDGVARDGGYDRFRLALVDADGVR